MRGDRERPGLSGGVVLLSMESEEATRPTGLESSACKTASPFEVSQITSPPPPFSLPLAFPISTVGSTAPDHNQQERDAQKIIKNNRVREVEISAMC